MEDKFKPSSKHFMIIGLFFLLYLISLFGVTYVQELFYSPIPAIYFYSNFIIFLPIIIICLHLSFTVFRFNEFSPWILKLYRPVLMSSVLVFILSFNSYTYITSNGIYNNGLTSLNETYYEWDKVKRVDVSLWTERKSINRPDFNYTIVLENGNSYDLFRWDDLSGLRDIDQILYSRNVQFRFSINQGLVRALKREVEDQEKDFSIIENILKRDEKTRKTLERIQNGA